MTLTVDDQYKERWSAPGVFNMLASSQVKLMIYQKQIVNYPIIQVYVGGSPSDLSHRSVRKGMFGFHKNELPRNFLGCLKKVTHCFVSFSLSRLLTIFV